MNTSCPTLLVSATRPITHLQPLEAFPRPGEMSSAGPAVLYRRPWWPMPPHLGAGRPLIEQVWARAGRCVLDPTAFGGLDTPLFPALVDSPVPLTNSSGVHSRSLGEFVAAGVLFFAKDLHRMQRSQAAGRWDPFDVEEAHGDRASSAGIGRLLRRLAKRARVLALRRRPQSEATRWSIGPWGNERLHELMAGSRTTWSVSTDAGDPWPGGRGLPSRHEAERGDDQCGPRRRHHEAPCAPRLHPRCADWTCSRRSRAG